MGRLEQPGGEGCSHPARPCSDILPAFRQPSRACSDKKPNVFSHVPTVPTVPTRNPRVWVFLQKTVDQDSWREKKRESLHLFRQPRDPVESGRNSRNSRNIIDFAAFFVGTRAPGGSEHGVHVGTRS